MAKSQDILLGESTVIPILYEDRAVLAIDKPPGWMLAPVSWDRTSRNLQREIELSISAREFWARSRNLKYLRFVHRLDAETSGVLLLAKSPGALSALQQMFETGTVEKFYLAVVRGIPKEKEWTCRLALAPKGQGSTEQRTVQGKSSFAKPAETLFRVVQRGTDTALVVARPVTGRTHQIRVHLEAAGHPVVGDTLYGQEATVGSKRRALPQRQISNLKLESQAETHAEKRPMKEASVGAPLWPMALRAVALSYRDPFTGKLVQIEAPIQEFARTFGFDVQGKGVKQLCVHS